eukprot:TRINITY_DN5746_c0_g1_i2.p1 TRINITY_DN5746_c0_g1~~TRINITY_DN5746_c0_g1_i2.p1  ORF type:complete len:441 (+),score=46.17 TRINITY_DN5746_c0_g1_i2:133-1455(+)
MIVNDFEVLTNSQNRIQSIKKCIYINNEENQKDQVSNFNSPYKNGKKNSEYINPSYVSSDAFYPNIQFDSIDTHFRPVHNKSPSILQEQRQKCSQTPTKQEIDKTQHDVISYDLYLQQQQQQQPHNRYSQHQQQQQQQYLLQQQPNQQTQHEQYQSSNNQRTVSPPKYSPSAQSQQLWQHTLQQEMYRYYLPNFRSAKLHFNEGNEKKSQSSKSLTRSRSAIIEDKRKRDQLTQKIAQTSTEKIEKITNNNDLSSYSTQQLTRSYLTQGGQQQKPKNQNYKDIAEAKKKFQSLTPKITYQKIDFPSSNASNMKIRENKLKSTTPKAQPNSLTFEKYQEINGQKIQSIIREKQNEVPQANPLQLKQPELLPPQTRITPTNQSSSIISSFKNRRYYNIITNKDLNQTALTKTSNNPLNSNANSNQSNMNCESTTQGLSLIHI